MRGGVLYRQGEPVAKTWRADLADSFIERLKESGRVGNFSQPITPIQHQIKSPDSNKQFIDCMAIADNSNKLEAYRKYAEEAAARMLENKEITQNFYDAAKAVFDKNPALEKKFREVVAEIILQFLV